MLEFYLEALSITTRIEYSSELNVLGGATERLINLIQAVVATIRCGNIAQGAEVESFEREVAESVGRK